MKAKLYILNGEILNVGDWEIQNIFHPETNEIIGVRNPIPEGVDIIESGEYYFDQNGKVIIK